MEAYVKSDHFKGVTTNPSFIDVSHRDLAVIEAPTKITRGLAAPGT